MHTRDETTPETTSPSSGTTADRRIGWFFAALAVIGLLVLGFEHHTHLLNWLPGALHFPAR